MAVAGSLVKFYLVWLCVSWTVFLDPSLFGLVLSRCGVFGWVGTQAAHKEAGGPRVGRAARSETLAEPGALSWRPSRSLPTCTYADASGLDLSAKEAQKQLGNIHLLTIHLGSTHLERTSSPAPEQAAIVRALKAEPVTKTRAV